MRVLGFIITKGGCFSHPKMFIRPKELIAHALGHHFLHTGNHLAVSSGTYSWDKLQERQADVFTAYLLMPEMNNSSVQEITRTFLVTDKFASFRLKLMQAYKE